MQLPRFLWVPFELGRPFGAPNAPDFQKRVLAAALELLEREDGPVILEDFPEAAPVADPNQEGPAWTCPITFPSSEENQAELPAAVFKEIDLLSPWHEIYVEKGGRPMPRASGLETKIFITLLAELAAGAETPEAETMLPIHEWVRLGCDELRAWYVEAAQGQPGRATAIALPGLVLARNGRRAPDWRGSRVPPHPSGSHCPGTRSPGHGAPL